MEEEEEYRSCCALQNPTTATATSLPSLPFLLPDCLVLPTCRGENGREKGGGKKKQHLIRSSYSTSFKGTLNDVFLGGDNCTLLLMHKEALSRGGVRTGCGYSCARSGWPRFGRRESPTRSGGLSPSPFFFVVGGWGLQRQKGGGQRLGSDL